MMDRLAQSPLRLATLQRKTKSQKKYQIAHEIPDKNGSTSRKRRLAPLANTLPTGSATAQRVPTEKARAEYEAALQRRDFQQVLWLITTGEIDATYETRGGETALLAAIAARNEDAFRLVMQCSGVSIDGRNRHGYTPLMKAIAAAAPFAEASHTSSTNGDSKPKQKPQPSKLKQKTGPVKTSNNSDDKDAEEEEKVGKQEAEAWNNCMVTCVLARNPDLHVRDLAGHTAFDWATRLRNSEAIALLHAHQVQMRAQHADFADRDSRQRECEQLLRRHDVVAAEMETLLRIPLLQETQMMHFLTQTPLDLTEFDVSNALLDYAALTKYDSAKTTSPFVPTFYLNRETRDGWTPLTKAAASGFTETVRWLVSRGVDVSYESSRLKHTALTWASCCGHEGVVLLLLREAGAELLTQQTREGKTALMHAVSNQQLKVLRHLLHAIHERCVRKASGKETFHYNENAIVQFNSPTRRRLTKWGGRPVSTPAGSSKRKPGTAEWHELFLETLRVQDASGRDAEAYAALLQPGDTDQVQAIQQELSHAITQATDHRAYVALHQSLTIPTPCKYTADGCDHIAPLDLLAAHELHECTKRRIYCERCGDEIAHAQQQLHDQSKCVQRLVRCVNRQHGCDARLVLTEREAHEQDHCRKRLVECRLGCGNTTLKYDERDTHEAVQCVRRLIECPRACGAAPFPANTSGRHKRSECIKRLVKCTSGCGVDVALDQMTFHVATLCEMRKMPCKWRDHGCDVWTGGAADSRRHHEEMDCPFRLVTCRHDGCTVMKGSLLACFMEDHYAWQCSLERRRCGNACSSSVDSESDGETMAMHWLDAHTQSDCGNCSHRLTRCRLDLCGKTIKLFDWQTESGALRLTSDPEAAAVAAATAPGSASRSETVVRVSMRAMRQRLDRTTTFLEKLRTRHHQEEQEDKDGVPVEKEAVFWQSAVARELLLSWLEPLHTQLQDQLDSLYRLKHDAAVTVRVLSFNSETSHHLVEFQQRSGHCEWIDLANREYDVLLPGDTNKELPTAGQQNVSAFQFQCGLVVAKELSAHESHDCGLRLVACPLSCGQRLTSHSIAHHLAKRCNLRNATCRLGCGTVLPFLQLSEHEDAHCVLRQTHCDHCHEAMAHRTLATHVATHCTQLPRRCRLGCSLQLPSAQFHDHETQLCPKRLVPCAQCEKHVWASELERHAREECALRVFGACDAGCGRSLRVNERAYHLLYDCARRKLPCPQCHESIVWQELAQHKRLLCKYRDVYCRRGCGQKLKEMDCDMHESEHCERRVVDCTNRCGEQLAFVDLHAHLALQCSMRVVACPHDCGEKLFAYQCESHWRRCRQRLYECGAGAKQCARPIRLWISNRRLAVCKTHHESGFLWALKTQDEDLVAYFLQQLDHKDDKSGVNCEFVNGFTALAIAASLGNVEIAKLLLRAGADVNQETSRGRSPLLEATMARDPAMVALLLEHRASVGHVNRHGTSVLSVAESLAASSNASLCASSGTAGTGDQSNAQRVLELLRAQQELENDQRALFTAIATSDYAYVAQLFKYSSGTAGVTLVELQQQVETKQQAFEEVQLELDESVKLLNESIADTESKTTQSQRMHERVADCTSQLAKIESFHEASLADSHALESEMLAHIREITAVDIAKLLNTNTPTPEYVVVMKSICLFCGVMPRGRRNASEYSDHEWWKTAQALLMDRSLLSKLRGYRNQGVTPDVMNKVRRECLRTQAFATSTKAFEGLSLNGFTPQEDGYAMVDKIPRRDALKGDIVGILATWVRGVELEYKATTVRQTLSEKKRRLAVSLNADHDILATSVFEMHVATRSLPARQEEVQLVETKKEAAERQLQVATQKLRAFKLIQYAALNGHTALSFASAVGNDAMVHMLLASGASGGILPEERECCAALIQLLFREFLFRRRRERASSDVSVAVKSRSDEAMEALVRNVAQTFLLGHFKRRRRHLQLTHRVAIHEAVYNGHWQIAEILLAQGHATLSQKSHVFPTLAMPGSPALVTPEPTSALELRRRGGWQLVPLTGSRDEDEEDDAKETKRGDDGEETVVKTRDPRELEQRLAPLTLDETLSHALWKCDSKTFLRDAGGWTGGPHSHSLTKLSETSQFVTSALTKARELRTTQLREIQARKNVAKKTRERASLHSRLDDAIVKRDFHAISNLLDDGAFADYETRKDGLTPLMAACMEETYVRNSDGTSVLAVAFLMDRGSNHPFVNFESSSGRTALATAAFYGRTLCAQELVERGANVNLKTRKHGETPLMAAARNGQTLFVEYLLHHRETDVFVTDMRGNTALDLAKQGGFHDTQRVLAMAMSGGNRGRVFASESALYGVCKWGCGFMAATRSHEIASPSAAMATGPKTSEKGGSSGRVVAVLQDTQPLAHHEAVACPKRLVTCPNQCGISTLWAEYLDRHLKSECDLRRVTCPQPKCAASVVCKELLVHNTSECEFRMVTCECGERMTHQKHVLHARNQCTQRLVPCPLQCRVDSTSGISDPISLIKFCELKDHERSHCMHRRVRCRNGCVVSELQFKDRETHETQRCVLRRVVCKWGCGEPVLANTQLYHESDECVQRELACPNKCGATVAFLSLDDHVANTCVRRLTICARGCGRRVPLHLMATHVQSECRRRKVQCALCHEELQEMELPAHTKSACMYRLSVCALCGQSDITQCDMATHRSDHCRMRVVTCRFNCYAAKPLLSHQKLHHEQFECAFRPIFCPMGCGKTIIAHTTKKHERFCEMRIVACGNGCGVELRERERAEHERRYCSSASSAAAKALQRGKQPT